MDDSLAIDQPAQGGYLMAFPNAGRVEGWQLTVTTVPLPLPAALLAAGLACLPGNLRRPRR